MWQSPCGQDSIVRRSIELQYANAQRSAAVRRLPALAALLALLAYDLWHWRGGCGCGWQGAVAAAEALLACVLAGSVARHAARLLPSLAPRLGAAPCPLSPTQMVLLGLRDDELADGSFCVRGEEAPPAAAARRERERGAAEDGGSLSPARSWRGAADSPPPSPPSPASPASPPSPRLLGQRASPDEFISDGRALAAYIRAQESREAEATPGAGVGGRLLLPAPARAHQLAVLPERSTKEGCGDEEEGTGAAGAGGAPLWRRLLLDPQRLTEYNLNLRLWLHVSVVGRVARELAAAEAAGVSLAGVGGAAGGGGAGGTRADALLPFLRPYADRQYVADRIKELSRGGCLSAYRWAGGGRGWDAARPADAELLLHLFATYLDLVVPGGDFSARHLCSAPASPAARARAPPGAPVLRRAGRHPPHYVLLLGDETIELPQGRNNLLHTLLLFLAAAARGTPPALCRMHLGPAGLNMLWILGR